MVHFSSMTTAEVQIFHKERWFQREASAKVTEELGNRDAALLVGRDRIEVQHGERLHDPLTISQGEKKATIHQGESVVFDAGDHIIKVKHEGVIKKLG